MSSSLTLPNGADIIAITRRGCSSTSFPDRTHESFAIAVRSECGSTCMCQKGDGEASRFETCTQRGLHVNSLRTTGE